MNPTAVPPPAQETIRTTFEWARIQSNTDWILPIVVCLAIMLLVRYLYRRDAHELGRGWGWLLTALRTAAFYGLLILYLQPQWRNEREETHNSKALLLADTSLSMSLTDTADTGAKSDAAPSRADQVAALLGKTGWLAQLRKTHDVVVWRFDQELNRVATLAKLPAEAAAPGAAAATGAAPPAAADSIDWQKALAPAGTETRLGQALQQLIHDEQSATLAGLVVFTDGGQNAGIAPDAAIQAAQEMKLPILTVGLGSDRQPAHVRISDLAAPARAYPGDRYTVTGYLQAQRLAGRMATVELASREAGSGTSKPGPERLEATRQVPLGADGDVVPVKFDLLPDKTGRRTLTLRVKAPGVDRNASDLLREADVEIVDHKNHVLLWAGGPQREYQFLRNLLYRDKSTTVDVLLQTSQPGISQESNQVLSEFPSTREAMFSYDCVVAIDPDWQVLNAEQVSLLEKWVAEQGGGLIVAAGPVNAGKTINGWVQSPALGKVRALYPVEFQRSVTMMDTSAYLSKDPWPLDFTREGLEAEYLWLDDSAAASQTAWGALAGVYGYYPVRGAKPGAAVLARFSDPRTGQSGQQPVYFAAQFYGSGRTFYMGSAEMWRLRRADEAYFEKFYTKLVRHVSQGRLLRGSTRGVLLVGQEHGYLVGNNVEIRSQLTNAQLEPLVAPGVAVQVYRPDGSTQTVTLHPDPGRTGTFAGHFTATREGTYRLELPIPDSGDQRLTRRLQVDLPQSELKEPQRNDVLLRRIAEQTGGRYYIGTAAALTSTGSDALLGQLKDRTVKVILTAAPDEKWEETWLRWIMVVLISLLCLEWLIRRLLKLA